MNLSKIAAGVSVALLVLGSACNTASTNLTELTAAQAKSVGDAFAQLDMIGSLAGATQSTADQTAPTTKAIRAGQPVVTCPAITVAIDNGAFSIELDFGDGCTPAAYPDVTFSGMATGTIQFAARSLNLMLNSFSAGQYTTTGALELSFENSTDSASVDFDATVTATTAGRGIISGAAMWSIIKATGLTTITTVNAQGIDADSTEYSLAIANAVIDGQKNGNFRPESGAMTIGITEQVNPFFTQQTSIVITFTAQTPVDGTVEVSINGGTSFMHQLG